MEFGLINNTSYFKSDFLLIITDTFKLKKYITTLLKK